MTDIVDHSDFCRKCLNTGIYGDEECFYCRGTGSRTVLVAPSPQERGGQ